MKNVLKVFIPVMVVLALTLTSCSPPKAWAEKRKVVAEVNGQKILLTDYLDAYASEKSAYGITAEVEKDPQYKDQINSIKKGILEDMIYRKIISQKLKEAGLKVDSEVTKEATQKFNEVLATIESQMKAQDAAANKTGNVDYAAKARDYANDQLKQMGKTQKQYIDMIAEQIMTQKLKDKTVSDIQVTDDEIKAYYEDQVNAQKQGAEPPSADLALYSGPQVQVKHILIQLPQADQTEYANLMNQSKTEEAKKYLDEKLKGIYPKAKEVLDKVKNGGDFEKLMDQYGEDPGMKNNPEGYTVKHDGQFIPEFENASFALKEGQVSDLVAGPYGYHIIKAYKVSGETVATLQEKSDAIKKILASQKGDEKWASVLKDWMDKSQITKHEELL